MDDKGKRIALVLRAGVVVVVVVAALLNLGQRHVPPRLEHRPSDWKRLRNGQRHGLVGRGAEVGLKTAPLLALALLLAGCLVQPPSGSDAEPAPPPGSHEPRMRINEPDSYYAHHAHWNQIEGNHSYLAAKFEVNAPFNYTARWMFNASWPEDYWLYTKTLQAWTQPHASLGPKGPSGGGPACSSEERQDGPCLGTSEESDGRSMDSLDAGTYVMIVAAYGASVRGLEMDLWTDQAIEVSWVDGGTTMLLIERLDQNASRQHLHSEFELPQTVAADVRCMRCSMEELTVESTGQSVQWRRLHSGPLYQVWDGAAWQTSGFPVFAAPAGHVSLNATIDRVDEPPALLVGASLGPAHVRPDGRFDPLGPGVTDGSSWLSGSPYPGNGGNGPHGPDS